MEMTEIKSLIECQGEALAAFKAELGKEVAELKEGRESDVLTKEKVSRIEKSLDDAIEAKSAIEKKLAAQEKWSEELEAKLNRPGADGPGDNLEMKAFNADLHQAAKQRGRDFVSLDEKSYGQYKSATNTWMREGKDALSADEVKTLSVGSDPDGGYLVTPDVSGRMVKKVYETSAIRQIASVQTISTDGLEGIEDTDESDVGYAGEHSTSGTTTTPQIGKWRIPVYEIDCEPKTTQKLLDDASIDVESWLADKVANKFSRFENAEFVTGATKIRGFAGTSYTKTADSGSGVPWGEIGYVASGAAGAFKASGSDPSGPLVDLVGAVKDKHLDNARFVTRRSVITAIRKMLDGNGNMIWQPPLTAGNPETILGYPVTRAEDMPALGANSYSLAFGDFSAAYQVVDRQGLRVIRDNLTNKPYVIFYTMKRTGGAVLNFEAIKLMKFANS